MKKVTTDYHWTNTANKATIKTLEGELCAVVGYSYYKRNSEHETVESIIHIGSKESCVRLCRILFPDETFV